MTRQVMVTMHTGRRDALEAAREVCDTLEQEGIVPVLLSEEHAALAAELGPRDGTVRLVGEAELPGIREEIELVMILGGDGTILRAAERFFGTAVPLLGVNLGHVGFLAESEREDLSRAVHRVSRRDYTVEERLALDVVVTRGGATVERNWALNEAAVEKGNRERMLELFLGVDGRPITSFGCDGVILATPTGSTAYAFSSGGPVVWPEVEALLMTPISAHALFARPLVVAPTSTMSVEIAHQPDDVRAVLWCDGRRSVDLYPGDRVVARRSVTPLRLARLSPGPFTDRLVAKFHLPIHGWRGSEEGTEGRDA